jgi:hypothetical protein
LMNMNKDHLWNKNWQGKTEVLRRRTCGQCHLVYHKSHMYSLGIEPGTPRVRDWVSTQLRRQWRHPVTSCRGENRTWCGISAYVMRCWQLNTHPVNSNSPGKLAS